MLQGDHGHGTNDQESEERQSDDRQLNAVAQGRRPEKQAAWRGGQERVEAVGTKKEQCGYGQERKQVGKKGKGLDVTAQFFAHDNRVAIAGPVVEVCPLTVDYLPAFPIGRPASPRGPFPEEIAPLRDQRAVLEQGNGIAFGLLRCLAGQLADNARGALQARLENQQAIRTCPF